MFRDASSSHVSANVAGAANAAAAAITALEKFPFMEVSLALSGLLADGKHAQDATRRLLRKESRTRDASWIRLSDYRVGVADEPAGLPGAKTSGRRAASP